MKKTIHQQNASWLDYAKYMMTESPARKDQTIREIKDSVLNKDVYIYKYDHKAALTYLNSFK